MTVTGEAVSRTAVAAANKQTNKNVANGNEDEDTPSHTQRVR